MSEIIERVRAKRGRPPIHPWDEWADGQSRRLRRGTAEQVAAGEADFTSALTSFRTQVHREAKSRGMKAMAPINKAGQSIEVVFYFPGAEPRNSESTEAAD